MFIALPTFFYNGDIWDGTVITEAAFINNLEPIKNWFYSSSWHLQYFQIAAFEWLSNTLNVNYYKLDYWLTLSVFAIFINETYLLCNRVLNFYKKQAFMACLLASSFPIWSIMMSTVMTFHFICFTLSLCAVRLIYSKKLLKIALGYILFLIAINLNSLLVFAPVLALVYDFNLNPHKKIIAIPNKNVIILFFLGCLYFVLKKKYLPSYGNFSSYNEISLNIKHLILHTLRFLTYSIPLLIALLFYIIMSFFKRRKKTNSKFILIRNKQVIVLFLLCISSIFAYILAGKSSIIIDHRDWDIRHAMLLSVPLSIFSVALLNRINELYFKNNFKIYSIAISIIISIQSIISLDAYLIKENRLNFEDALVNALNESKTIENPFLLNIKDMPKEPRYRPYEVLALYNKLKPKERISIKHINNNGFLFYTKDNFNYLKTKFGVIPKIINIESNGFDVDRLNFYINKFKGIKKTITIL